MVVFPNAKVNIGLRITGKRPDGFHDIESCFYPAPWHDILEIVVSDRFAFNHTGLPIPEGKNLCVKAFELLAADYSLPAVSIHLHKLVPIGAGLGGGSSDGAFTLKVLNEMFELGLSAGRLQEYALELGSDCPFFIHNKPAFVAGRGEIFEPVDFSLRGKYMAIVFPSVHVSTAEAYAGIRNYSKPGFLKPFLESAAIPDLKREAVNDFEGSIIKKYPEIGRVKDVLYHEGAEYASMTGSGSSVFGIFEEKKDIQFPPGCTVKFDKIAV